MSERATEDLTAQIRSLAPWHHDIEIIPGVSTWETSAGAPCDERFGNPQRVSPDEHFTPLLRRLYPTGLGGRSFLDCACNAGGYTFTARNEGAGRSFGFDARQLWIDQARLVAAHRPSDGVQFEVMTLADLPALQPEPFDVTFFGGIFYHLPDPVAGLRIAADLTKEMLIVNTAGVPGDGLSLRLGHENVDKGLAGIEPLSWLPTGPRVVQDVLAWCGFPHSRVDYEIALANGRIRLQIVAAREASALSAYDAAAPEASPVWAKDKSIAKRMAEAWARASKPS